MLLLSIISVHPRSGRGQAIRQVVDLYLEKKGSNNASLRNATGNGPLPRVLPANYAILSAITKINVKPPKGLIINSIAN